MEDDKILEETLIVVKPDAVQRGLVGKIIARFEEAGFVIREICIVERSRNFWELFYEEHKNKGFFNNLVEYMLSGEAIAIVFSRQDAILKARELIGPLPPNAPHGTIRGDYAIDFRRNAVHASCSQDAFERERKICFESSI